MPNSTFFVYDHQFEWSYNLEKNSVRKEETRAENRIKKEATQHTVAFNRIEMERLIFSR